MLVRYVFDFELPLSVWYIVLIGSVIVVERVLYFLVHSGDKGQKIYKEKPTVFNNHRYSGYFFGVVMGVPFLVMILLLFYLAIKQG